MKKVKNFLMTLLPSFFVLGMCLPALINNSQKEDPGLDTAVYDNNLVHAQFERPDILRGEAADEDDEEEVIEVDKVILHYYNESGGCDGRAFYLWVTGEDGVEYSLDNAKDIMSVSNDNTMMTIQIDFSDVRFAAYKNKSSMYFIIKFKKVSETNLNWGGQSDDVQLRYAEFPPTDKVCEVWTMPAAGGGIALLDSEAKTQVHGVKLAKFTDWKTISCQLTANTSKVNWKLYAFDETYFKIKPKKRAAQQKWYLVQEGSNTGDFEIKLKYEAHINLVYSLVSHDPNSDSDPAMKELDKTVTVGFDKLYDSAKFHTYYEEGVQTALNKAGVKPLGMTYSATATTFKVWSPVSANMNVLIYDTDTPKEYGGEDTYKGYHMHYTTGGIWELTIDGDLKGKYYTYQVDNTLGTNVIMDPYATSAGCCGIRGYIYDKADSNPEGWDALPLKWDGVEPYDLKTPQDLTIYEVHMQDFTGDVSWKSNHGNRRGTYNAFVESGTTLTQGGYTVSTGYDHLNDLGVGAVQLVPCFDHDNDESTAIPEDKNDTENSTLKYNWGYNPLNYNVVEGGYSSNPHDGLVRVKEFKNLVLQMSKTEAHTRVIMDVVYNHVSSATGSNFHKLMPRYYFRYADRDYYNESGYKYQSEGELWDGSGCHNEVASERPMMRKFIVDSLCMWAKEYKIKGFRFDLMGLIDYQTLNEARKALYAIDPDIYLYGEGWTSGGYHGSYDNNGGASSWEIYNRCNSFGTLNSSNSVYLGGFNDCMRDAIRGNNGYSVDGKNYPGSGFIQLGAWRHGEPNWWYDHDSLTRISDGMWGVNRNVNTDGVMTGYYPEQTINYVSCHDNWTVRDQLFNTLPKRDADHPASLDAILKASLQAHALVMAGNSAAFILGGEELLRTKEYSVDPETTGVTADSWTELWGHKISHNSYNAPLSVNTFKWGNKIKVTCGDDQITNGVVNSSGAGYHYYEAFRTLIKSHKDLLKKRGENNGFEAFVTKTSAGNNVMNRYWSRGENDYTNCVAFQANEAFVYTCSGTVNEGDYVGCNESELASWNKIFEYGSYNIGGNKVNFTGTNVVLYYDRHGH